MRRETFDQQQAAVALRKAMALELAKDFCKKHGYNSMRLATQRYAELPSCVCFAQPTGIKPDGLRNDIATQPLPTLIIRQVDGRITFETTEHTDKYLKD